MQTDRNTTLARAAALACAIPAIAACTGITFHSDKQQQSYTAAIGDAAAEQRSLESLPCPTFGAAPTRDPEAARAELTKALADADAKFATAAPSFVKMASGYHPDRVRTNIATQLDTFEDAVGAGIIVKALKWEDAVVQSLAASSPPIAPTNLAAHPYWRGATAYQTDLAQIRRMGERLDTAFATAVQETGNPEQVIISQGFRLTPSQFTAPLAKAGSRIARCAAEYRPFAIAQSAGILESHARSLKTSADVDKFVTSLGLPPAASSPPDVAQVRVALITVSSEKKAAEGQAAANERVRLQQEAQRQAQLAAADQARRNEAARVAADQRAAAQAQFVKNQETWRAAWASKNSGRSYLCEGSGYSKDSVSNIFNADGRGTRSLVRFVARFTPDYKRMDILTSDGGFGAGRYPIQFVSPTEVRFTFTRHIETIGVNADYDGTAQIDLTRGAEELSGFIEYTVPGLITATYSTSYEGFCNTQ